MSDSSASTAPFVTGSVIWATASRIAANWRKQRQPERRPTRAFLSRLRTALGEDQGLSFLPRSSRPSADCAADVEPTLASKPARPPACPPAPFPFPPPSFPRSDPKHTNTRTCTRTHARARAGARCRHARIRPSRACMVCTKLMFWVGRVVWRGLRLSCSTSPYAVKDVPLCREGRALISFKYGTCPDSRARAPDKQRVVTCDLGLDRSRVLVHPRRRRHVAYGYGCRGSAASSPRRYVTPTAPPHSEAKARSAMPPGAGELTRRLLGFLACNLPFSCTRWLTASRPHTTRRHSRQTLRSAPSREVATT